MAQYWFGAIALVISGATLVTGLLNARYQARKSYVETVEKRVERLESELSACQARCEMLQEENLRLMRQLLKRDA